MKSLTLAFLALATVASAQVNVTTGTYTQNFDGLANSGSGLTWTDNSTLQGWFTNYNGAPVQALGVDSGRNGTRLVSSYGSVGSTDRALGTGFNVIGGSEALSFGARLVNATGTDFTSFTVSYTGEQWARNSNGTPLLDSLAFSYQIFDSGTGSLSTSTGWTTVSALSLTAPNTTPSTVQTDLNGNAVGNFTNIFGSVTGIALAEDQELWVRWTATNVSGAGHDLAIDNLNVTFGAIPEPASFAALVALAGLGFAGAKRRRRN